MKVNRFAVSEIRLERQKQSHGDHRQRLQSFTAVLTRFSRKLLPMTVCSILPIRAAEMGRQSKAKPSKAIEVTVCKVSKIALERKNKPTDNKRIFIRGLRLFFRADFRQVAADGASVSIAKSGGIDGGGNGCRGPRQWDRRLEI